MDEFTQRMISESELKNSANSRAAVAAYRERKAGERSRAKAKRKTLSAYNGRTRRDGYDAHMRPVTRRDNAPGSATHRVRYTSPMDGHTRTLYCYSEDEARRATLHGSALDGDVD